MTLFESPSQFREKAAICRIFETLPLQAPLAEGHIFRWFALNTPMDLGTGGSFTSDMDVIACLLPLPKSVRGRSSYPPHSDGYIYKTWEVKVSLLCRDGTARSLKSGKTANTIKQLRAYRRFGSSNVSLLDVYICETGFMDRNSFPPYPAQQAILAKIPDLKSDGFGYQILPFEHDKDGDVDIGLKTFHVPTWYGSPSTNFMLLPAIQTAPVDGFASLIKRLNSCYEREEKRITTGKGFVCVVFCRSCRQLSLKPMKDASSCGHCGKDLRLQ
ncbi:MAG TPA: hypothetical protein VNF27_07125 [Candidatus Binataceae bacterium]|nr:hypothetical protein [Candidatus Binataceae bacterium]